MHPLDTLAQLDLARHDHDRDRAVHDAADRRAASTHRAAHPARRRGPATPAHDPVDHR